MKERWRALDLLRFVAVVMMVQGHAFTALLDPSLRRGAWFVHHDYLHGLTAPLFFFASGVAFGVATLNHWQSHTSWGPPVKRRLARYGWLLFIGYMLNLPGLSFHYLLTGPSPETAQAFFRVDALQHIAVALIIVEGLVLLTKEPRRFAVAVALVGACLVFAAPAIWRLPVEQWVPLGVAEYLNANTGSVFPLFPWMGFICVGAITAYLSIDPRDQSLRRRLALRFAAVGFLLWSIARVLQDSGINPFGDHDYWKTSPIFFFTRSGLILLGFSGLCATESMWAWWRRREGHDPASTKRSLLQSIGQETLVIYVIHLILLYGSPFFRGLNGHYKPILSVGTASWVSVMLLVVSIAFALLWSRARNLWPLGFRRFQYALAATVVLAALVR